MFLNNKEKFQLFFKYFYARFIYAKNQRETELLNKQKIGNYFLYVV